MNPTCVAMRTVVTTVPALSLTMMYCSATTGFQGLADLGPQSTCGREDLPSGRWPWATTHQLVQTSPVTALETATAARGPRCKRIRSKNKPAGRLEPGQGQKYLTNLHQTLRPFVAHPSSPVSQPLCLMVLHFYVRKGHLDVSTPYGVPINPCLWAPHSPGSTSHKKVVP